MFGKIRFEPEQEHATVSVVEQLEALSERLGTPGVRYEVVRVPPVDHEGPQFFGKTSDYEIHVLLPQPPSCLLYTSPSPRD